MNRRLSTVVSVLSLITRIVCGRRTRYALAAVGFLVVSSPPAFAQCSASRCIQAFGNTLIRLPQSAGAGTIVARYYLTPQQLCSSSTCTLNAVYLFPADASGAQPGPVIATYAPSIATRILINGQPVTGGAQSRSTAQPVEIQLLSNGQQTVQANMNGSNPAWAHPFYQLSINQPSGGSADTQIFLWPTVVPVPGTCSVPDQTVTLPAVKASQFSGVGSTAGARSFDIQFNNCPWGYGRVGYTFVPVGGSPTMYTGALPLSANSTASGVGIQIVNASGSPVMFNNSIQLAAYNPSTGGSYSLPHTASYIQTADSITSGSVNGSMQVLVDYQ